MGKPFKIEGFSLDSLFKVKENAPVTVPYTWEQLLDRYELSRCHEDRINHDTGYAQDGLDLRWWFMSKDWQGYLSKECSYTVTCPSCLEGQAVTVTNFEGKFTSLTSQYEADSLSVQDTATRAKEKLYCYVTNDAVIITQECEVDMQGNQTYGQPSTVTVPSGKFKIQPPNESLTDAYKTKVNSTALDYALLEASSKLNCMYYNQEQSYEGRCPEGYEADGLSVTVPFGTVSGPSQETANQSAHDEAKRRAAYKTIDKCERVWYNTAASEIRSCPESEGLYGNVSVSVPAGVVRSTVSKADMQKRLDIALDEAYKVAITSAPEDGGCDVRYYNVEYTAFGTCEYSNQSLSITIEADAHWTLESQEAANEQAVTRAHELLVIQQDEQCLIGNEEVSELIECPSEGVNETIVVDADTYKSTRQDGETAETTRANLTQRAQTELESLVNARLLECGSSEVRIQNNYVSVKRPCGFSREWILPHPDVDPSEYYTHPYNKPATPVSDDWVDAAFINDNWYNFRHYWEDDNGTISMSNVDIGSNPNPPHALGHRHPVHGNGYFAEMQPGALVFDTVEEAYDAIRAAMIEYRGFTSVEAVDAELAEYSTGEDGYWWSDDSYDDWWEVYPHYNFYEWLCHVLTVEVVIPQLRMMVDNAARADIDNNGGQCYIQGNDPNADGSMVYSFNYNDPSENLADTFRPEVATAVEGNLAKFVTAGVGSVVAFTYSGTNYAFKVLYKDSNYVAVNMYGRFFRNHSAYFAIVVDDVESKVYNPNFEAEDGGTVDNSLGNCIATGIDNFVDQIQNTLDLDGNQLDYKVSVFVFGNSSYKAGSVYRDDGKDHKTELRNILTNINVKVDRNAGTFHQTMLQLANDIPANTTPQVTAYSAVSFGEGIYGSDTDMDAFKAIIDDHDIIFNADFYLPDGDKAIHITYAQSSGWYNYCIKNDLPLTDPGDIMDIPDVYNSGKYSALLFRTDIPRLKGRSELRDTASFNNYPHLYIDRLGANTLVDHFRFS